jgi:hypothetical protein
MEDKKKYTDVVGFEPSTPELEVAPVYEYKELSPEEEARLIDALEAKKREPAEKKYEVFLVDGTAPEAQLGRSLEVEVFGEFFKNDEALMQREYSLYEAHSKFLVVIDHENKKAAGVMRLISNSDKGLKSVNDIAAPPWNKPKDELFAENNIKEEDLVHAWDIATLAVSREYRGKTSVASALYHGLYKGSLENGITEWVAVLDDNVLQLLEALGLFFSKYKDVGSASYLDSPSSTPVYANVKSMIENMSKVEPSSYEYLALGQHGIDKNIDFSEIY